MEGCNKKKLVFVTNVDWFFISHRLPLALYAIETGYEVYLLTCDTGQKSYLQSLGIHFIDIPFERSGKNPLHECKCIWKLVKAYKQIKPTVIHHITLKAALLGSVAAKLSQTRAVVNAISGLGYNFTDNRNGWLQKTIKLLIKVAFKSKSFSFILQNPDDVQMIQGLDLVPTERIHLIKGSGVDLNTYSFTELPNKSPLVILFPARILFDKGIKELLAAANLLRANYEKKIKFVLAGDCDRENLTAMNETELQQYLIPGYIEWIGFQKAMVPVYKGADIVALPSYREGLPKSLIDACAIGRPIITTDVPGCRECVTHGYNGYLVPAKDVNSLAHSIEQLVASESDRRTFGYHSRQLAERDFSIENVVKRHFEIYACY